VAHDDAEQRGDDQQRAGDRGGTKPSSAGGGLSAPVVDELEGCAGGFEGRSVGLRRGDAGGDLVGDGVVVADVGVGAPGRRSRTAPGGGGR
jgi:hypothetical protein